MYAEPTNFRQAPSHRVTKKRSNQARASGNYAPESVLWAAIPSRRFSMKRRRSAGGPALPITDGIFAVLKGLPLAYPPVKVAAVNASLSSAVLKKSSSVFSLPPTWRKTTEKTTEWPVPFHCNPCGSLQNPDACRLEGGTAVTARASRR